MRCFEKLFLGMFIVCFSIISEAQVLRYRPGQYSFFTRYEFIDTNSNFDSQGGSFTKLDSGNSFSASRIPIRLQYDVSYNLAVLADLEISGSKSDDGSEVRTKNLMSSLTAGFQYKALKKPFLIVPQVLVKFPFETVERGTNNTLISDGAIEVEGGAWMQKKFWKLYNYLYLGATFRDSGLSFLGNYKLGTYTRLANFYVGGNLEGFTSLTDDEFTNDPTERTDVTDDVMAGSLLYYSINPEAMYVEGWAGYIINNNALIKAGYKQGINGANYARTSNFWIGVDIRNFYTKSVEERENDARRERINNLNDQFQPEEDTMDDGNFSEEELEREIEFKFDEQNKPLKK